MSGFEGMVSLRPAQAVTDNTNASLGEVAGATFAETLASNPSTAYYREKYLENAYAMSPDTVDAPSARERLKSEGLEGRLQIPDQGIPRFALDTLIDRKREEVKREDVLSRAPPGIASNSVRLAVGLGGSLLDPLNVAAGFFPVIGEARYAQLLARAPLGIVGRTAVRAGVGAVEGTAGAAAIEPLVYSSKHADQADYSMGDSLANIAFGGVFGAGLHTMGGALGELGRTIRGGSADIAANVDPATRAQALKTAVAQAASGEPVNVEPLIKLDPAATRESVKPAAAEGSPAYSVREEPLTDEQIQKFQGLRSDVQTHQDVGGHSGGISERQGRANDGGSGAGADQSGEPLTVYRGSHLPLAPEHFADESLGKASEHPSSGLGVFFTNNPDDAARYGPNVSANHLDIRNPKVFGPGELPGFDSIKDATRFREGLRAAGHDGITLDYSSVGGPVQHVAFEPHQVIPAGRAEGAGHASGVQQALAERPNHQIPDATAKQAENDWFTAPTDSARASPAESARVDFGKVQEAAREPKLSTVADERASAQADRTLAEPQPTDDLARVQQDIADETARLKEAGIDPAEELAPYDEAIKDAQTYAKAARAAVLCGLAHVA